MYILFYSILLQTAIWTCANEYFMKIILQKPDEEWFVQ